MKLTQEDYEARKQRLADGTSQNPDEDNRLVEHYEREGFEWRGNSSDQPDGSTPSNSNESAPGGQSTAPSTSTPSKSGGAKGTSTVSSAVKSST